MLVQESDAELRLGIPLGGNARLGGAGHFLRHLETVLPILVPLVVDGNKPVEDLEILREVRFGDIANAFIPRQMGFRNLILLFGKRLAPQ